MDAKHIFITQSDSPEKIWITESGHYRVFLQKEGSEVEIFGGWLTENSDKIEIVIDIIHQARHTRSNTLLRGVARDNSNISLSGTIIVEKDAQNINAFLTENILLLSPKATAQAIPNLEIEANEVKCSHAATVSRIPEEHLFYLQSRGISREKAEEIIVDGFLSSVRQ